ncbi:Sentrin-specific protease 7, partial [Dufourea novaeangliae]
MDVESSETSTVLEQANQQHFSSQTDSENSSSESIAYLQQVIDNPTNTIVQHQIQGNTAKMLVTFANGEQRLITFDIPNEDCTVQDLLEQANIIFCGSTTVSLVSDPTLGINYIVDTRSSGTTAPHETNENDNSHDTSNTSLDHSRSSPDENSNPVQHNEKNNERNSSAKLEKLERDGSVYKRGRGRGRGAARPRPVRKEPDNYTQFPHTSLLCRTVRIGSYKYVPRERVVISQNGVRLGVPLLEDDTSFVTLEVKFQDIVKALIHFGKSMPVLFFYTSINTGAMIRELLGMQDPKGPYYDPAGKDHTHKRITLLPEKLSEEAKVVLKNLFMPRRLLEELSSKEANDILVRASPKDSLQLQSLSRRDSQGSSINNSNINGGIQTITVYPPPPAKGGIAINTEDYLCLGEDQFLNDVIIDFYLKYLTLEVLSESDQHRTHVFSSYFYKRLTSPHAQAVESNVVPQSPATKRHARVQKWTKNVNIFEKDFIVIPINEHAHWFLAIICFPGLVGEVSTNRIHLEENDVRKTVHRSKKLKEVKLQAVTIGDTTLAPVTTTITIDQPDDGSERDEAEGDDEEMEMDSEDDDESETTDDKSHPPKVEQNVPQEKDTVKLPCILIFDSLAGASRSRVVATLRDYLSCEYVAKMGSEKVFSKDTIKGASLKVPQQSNFTDCGLYVLQYVESFFKNPIKDYTLPIKTLKNWFEEITVTRKREELSKLLIKLMNATKGDKNITIPVVIFPTQDGKLKTKAENHIELKSIKSDVADKK